MRLVWLGGYLGFVLGSTIGLGHALFRSRSVGDLDVAAAVLLVEAGGLTLMGALFGGFLGLLRALLRKPEPVFVAVLLLGLLGMRVGLTVWGRSYTNPNRQPLAPDEPLVLVAGLAVAFLAYGLIATQRVVGRAAGLGLAAASVVLLAPLIGGVAALGQRLTTAGSEASVMPSVHVEIPVQEDGGRPNVLVISIDSLRPDYLSSYGAVNDTPNLDLLAREGARFTAASTVQPTTSPAHQSLLSGVYPATHGAREHIGTLLPDRFHTLATILQPAGYRTGGVFTYIGLRGAFSNLHRGFDLYEDTTIGVPAYLDNEITAQGSRLLRRVLDFVPMAKVAEDLLKQTSELEGNLTDRADVTTEAAVRFLRSAGPEDPFFLWVHYFGPHYPFTPPAPYDKKYLPPYDAAVTGELSTIRQIQRGAQLSPESIEYLAGLYAGEVSYTDQEIGRLFAVLRQRGVFDRTIIIVLADHGTSMQEHGMWFHNVALTQPMIAIPMLLRYPPAVPAGVVSDAPVQTIDVMPTVLDALGAVPPPEVEGRSLLPLANGEESGLDRVTVSETGGRGQIALRMGRWKLSLNLDEGLRKLFDLQQDPLESIDVATREPAMVQRLMEEYRRWAAAHP